MHFSRDITLRNFLIVLFFSFFLLGIITANLIDINLAGDGGTLTRYYLKQLVYAKWNSNALLVHIAGFRCSIFFALLLLGCMCKGVSIHYFFVAWNGFAYGYFCVAAIGGFGLFGLLLCMASIFPQFIVYVPAYWSLIELTGRWRTKNKLPWFGRLFLLIMLLTAGILLESYINPTILKKILHNI